MPIYARARDLGTLSAGVSLDRRLADRIKALTRSEVVFGSQGVIHASTLPDADRAALAPLLTTRRVAPRRRRRGIRRRPAPARARPGQRGVTPGRRHADIRRRGAAPIAGAAGDPGGRAGGGHPALADRAPALPAHAAPALAVTAVAAVLGATAAQLRGGPHGHASARRADRDDARDGGDRRPRPRRSAVPARAGKTRTRACWRRRSAR